jgi:hypothetical protein
MAEMPPEADESAVGAINRPLLLTGLYCLKSEFRMLIIGDLPV